MFTLYHVTTVFVAFRGWIETFWIVFFSIFFSYITVILYLLRHVTFKRMENHSQSTQFIYSYVHRITKEKGNLTINLPRRPSKKSRFCRSRRFWDAAIKTEKKKKSCWTARWWKRSNNDYINMLQNRLASPTQKPTFNSSAGRLRTSYFALAPTIWPRTNSWDKSCGKLVTLTGKRRR